LKEIGGYIELDTYELPMLHKDAIALNCGRNCLCYLIYAKNIKKIWIPYFLCDSIKKLCLREGVEVGYYSIDESFNPIDIELGSNEWIYIVNYYGQLSNDVIKNLSDKYKRTIVDNSHAYYQLPVDNVDTLYTCRKFFGVPDGAFLYTSNECKIDLDIDVSYERMNFLLGRFENNASDYYNEYVENNKRFAVEPLKRMSKLTNNLLHGILYEKIKDIRSENYMFLHESLKEINLLNVNEIIGPYAYPLMIDCATDLRAFLLENKIYVPLLWPNVLLDTSKDSLEFKLANNILPLPCDQRYSKDDMKWIIDLFTHYIPIKNHKLQ